VKADESPHVKECGAHCGHVSAVAVHPCPGLCAYEATLVCLDLWDSWMHPQAVAGAPDVHGCLTEPIEHYATGKFMYMCHLLHDCTRCAVT